jgi:hypothetical protein
VVQAAVRQHADAHCRLQCEVPGALAGPLAAPCAADCPIGMESRLLVALLRRAWLALFPAPQLLESCFLVSAVLVLMAGMVFSADGFTRGSMGYNLLTVLVSGVIIVATATFAVLLAFEVYRSVKYAEAHALARQVEEEAVEEALLGRWRRRSSAAGSTPSGGTRRRSSIVSALQRNSSLGRRLSVALGRSTTGPSPGSPGADGAPDGVAAVSGDGESAPQRRGSSLSESVVRQRRQSLLGRLQGVVGAGSGRTLLSHSGTGGDAYDDSAPVLAPEAAFPAQVEAPSSLPPPPPPPTVVPAPPALKARGGISATPPPPPPRHDAGSPSMTSGTRHAGVGLDTVVAAAATARSMRVHTMAAKERGAAARIRMVHAEPGPDSLAGTVQGSPVLRR